jgi:hypothetical protein
MIINEKAMFNKINLTIALLLDLSGMSKLINLDSPNLFMAFFFHESITKKAAINTGISKNK